MTTPLSDRVFLTTKEIAELLRVTAKTIREWSITGASGFPAPSVNRFRAMRWRRVLIEAWIEDQEKR